MNFHIFYLERWKYGISWSVNLTQWPNEITICSHLLGCCIRLEPSHSTLNVERIQRITKLIWLATLSIDWFDIIRNRSFFFSMWSLLNHGIRDNNKKNIRYTKKTTKSIWLQFQCSKKRQRHVILMWYILKNWRKAAKIAVKPNEKETLEVKENSSEKNYQMNVM